MRKENPVHAWEGIISQPLKSRLAKPRTSGFTMVMDKGLGINESMDLLAVAGSYIDYIKLGFGTAALYREDLLRNKISVIRAKNIHVYPGGTFLEIAVMQNKLREFLHKSFELGFSAIEVSDGTILMSQYTRAKAIGLALETGFTVISEVGKKTTATMINHQETIKQINSDLGEGVQMVILEARESGKGIGIFNENGEIIEDDLKQIISGITDLKKIMWEAPLKSQQCDLIQKFGANVNLGNIPPKEILSLEALRLGLRADTLKNVVAAQQVENLMVMSNER